MMKRIILLSTMLLMSSVVIFAQKGKVMAAEALIENGDLDGAQTRIDAAIVHPKTEAWPKTYLIGARVAMAKYEADKSKTDLLMNASDLFMKSAELDAKGNAKGKQIGKFKKDIKIALTFFMPEMQNMGIEAFNNDDFETALKAFQNVININKLSIYKEDNLPADSVFIYYSGLAATRSSQWDLAEKYFLEAAELSYGEGDVYLLLNEVYTEVNDSVKIEENLKNGFEKYPSDDRILTTLINYYLKASKNEEALVYLNAAIENDPTNHSFYNARGVMYDMNKDYDAALENYEKAIELKDDFFDPILNIGVIYYNRAAEEMNAANDIMDNKKFEIARDAAQETFRKSLPYIERANEIDSENPMVLETLKNLYYRFEMSDKYEEVTEKLKELE